jgi:hypothetical protein
MLGKPKAAEMRRQLEIVLDRHLQLGRGRWSPAKEL